MVFVQNYQKECPNFKTKEEIKELEEKEKQFEAVVKEEEDVVKMAEADEAFHTVIYNATLNNRLITILNNLREQMYRYRFEYIKDESQHQMLVKEHRRICESISSKDVVASKSAIREHIENQEKSIIRQIRLEKK